MGLDHRVAGPDAKLGDICRIYPEGDCEPAPIMAEVVGFKDKKTLLMPYEAVDGIGLGSYCGKYRLPLRVQVSQKLLGKTLDGLGRPIDAEKIEGASYPVEGCSAGSYEPDDY